MQPTEGLKKAEGGGGGEGVWSYPDPQQREIQTYTQTYRFQTTVRSLKQREEAHTCLSAYILYEKSSSLYIWLSQSALIVSKLQVLPDLCHVSQRANIKSNFLCLSTNQKNPNWNKVNRSVPFQPYLCVFLCYQIVHKQHIRTQCLFSEIKFLNP